MRCGELSLKRLRQKVLTDCRQSTVLSLINSRGVSEGSEGAVAWNDGRFVA